MQRIIDRFLNYVTINTKSNPESEVCPSSPNQLILARKVADELTKLGLEDIDLDKNGYLLATLPANSNEIFPTLGFIAHFDTSPDFCAENIEPQIHRNFDGGDLILNAKKNIRMSVDDFPELSDLIGHTIISTNGNTLLGSDDKSGITAIVSAMEFLLENPQIEHGKIRIGFTPDEEIGRGANLFDVKKFDADWAYTIDGGALGELEYANFNAASATIKISGKSIHPGYAYGKMINASLVANEFISRLPSNETPATTKDREGFYHLTTVKSDVNQAELNYIIRDFDKSEFENRKNKIRLIANELNKRYEKELVSFEIINQYFNMEEMIKPVFHIIDLAEKAMLTEGIKPKIKSIRGGTDGARLSYMGLPCPNIFTGGYNFHGPFEILSVDSLLKTIDVLVNICKMSKGLISN